MIRDSSLLAYTTLSESGVLGEQSLRILKLLSMYSCSTNMELSRRSGIMINAVSGRMNDLVKRGLVITNGKRQCRITGSLVYEWTLSERGNDFLQKVKI